MHKCVNLAYYILRAWSAGFTLKDAVCLEKNETKMYFVISPIKLGQFRF